jgi:hypothetical protein
MDGAKNLTAAPRAPELTVRPELTKCYGSRAMSSPAKPAGTEADEPTAALEAADQEVDSAADQSATPEVIEAILAAPESLREGSSPSTCPPRIEGVLVGVVRGFDAEGNPLVAFAPSPRVEPLRARATVALGAEDIGAEVALLFEQGDPCRPIVMGKMHAARPVAPQTELAAEVDGKRISFTAAEQIELRCGESSIVLTKAGKILIKGAYVLSRSTGVNRILGGSVQIN